MKRVTFHGRSLKAIRNFPLAARREMGHQLDRLQHGLEPLDWKPMPAVGKGVREIRIQCMGQYRAIYVVSNQAEIHVLHAFRKKSRKTPRADLDLARKALRGLEKQGRKR